MTVLSRIFINPQTRDGRKLLANRQALHATVMAAFPPDALDDQDQRVLWRLDSEAYRHTLYVLSPVQPDFTHLVEQAGWHGQTWESTSYVPFLNQLTTGQRWAFRLTANPVKSIRRPGQRGTVVPHVTPEQQIAWLLDRTAQRGFRILPVQEFPEQADVQVNEIRNLSFERQHDPRQKKRVALRIVQFDGSLEITDRQLFQQSLTSGIGRAKAYGCGLMTLSRR